MSNIPSRTKTWVAHPSRHRLGWQAAFIGLLSALAMSAVGPPPSPAALQTRGEIVNIVHEVTIAPISTSRLLLCPGETANLYVSVDKTVTRRVGGQFVVGNPQTVRNAAVGLSQNPGGIISVQQATPRMVGGLYFVHYVIRGERNGDAELNFIGTYDIGSQQYTATPATLRVRVICKFNIFVTSTYTLAGQRGHTSLSIVPSTIVEADANGVFQPVSVSVANSAVSFGACAGSHVFEDTTATITGIVGAVAGMVRFQIAYDPTSWLTTEGCKGKSLSASDTLSTLVAFPSLQLAGVPMTYNFPQTFADGTGIANLEIIRLEQ
jgi:hypothetical protein